jgi:hypothetical protein
MSPEISERSFERAIECALLQYGPDACEGDSTAVLLVAGVMRPAMGVAVALSLAYWMLISAGMKIPLRYAFGYPAGAAMALWIAVRSATRGARRVEWRGRTYDMRG